MESSHSGATVFAGTEMSAEESIVQKVSCWYDKNCVNIISFGKGAPVDTRASCGHHTGKRCMVLEQLNAAHCHDLIAKIRQCIDTKGIQHKTRRFHQLYTLTE